ncbi:MAG TPA: polynucleotide adenylyltransferase PcnB [Thiolinea sp.]|nr:polynucleotide adenylyltransferase PcnB [Thiolinea sp.]
MPEQYTLLPASEHNIDPDSIDPRSRDIIKRLQKAGYQAYLVGGCVRDLLLGHQPKDFDIATSAHPEQVRKLFSSCRLIGRRFRLAHIYYGRDYIEVATFRAPHDTGQQGSVDAQGRIIHDNVYGTLEEDVWRRDFTINALFYDPISGDVLDYVDGLADLRARRLRLIGDPQVRYREDPVRMIRALRFAAKLDCTLDGATGHLIRPMANLLDAVAPARLFDELLKLLHGGYGFRSLQLLEEYGVLGFLLPLTDESLELDQSGCFRRLLETALQNTDQRISEGKSVMPPFLFAVLLWEQVRVLADEIMEEEGCPEVQALNLAAGEIISDQVQCTAIPRRFSNITREIWTLQPRFSYRELRRANTLFNNQRFRASYDFLALRAEAGEGEEVMADYRWWTEFQQARPDDRAALCAPSARKRRKKRKNKSRQED